LSDDNVIKFRKPPPPPKPKKPKRPLWGIPPFVIVILAALAVGAVTYVLDQGRAAQLPSPQSGL
jgi:hypothetical protein